MNTYNRMKKLILDAHPTIEYKILDLERWLNYFGDRGISEALIALIEEENKIDVLRDDEKIEKLKVYLLGEVQSVIDGAYKAIERDKQDEADSEATYNNFLQLINDGVLDELYTHIDDVAKKIDDCCAIDRSNLSHSLKTNEYRNILKHFEAIKYVVDFGEYPNFKQTI